MTGPIQAAQIFTDGRLNERAPSPVAHTLFMTSLFEWENSYPAIISLG